jgi:phospholipase/carboxylesterase/glyoxalase family protein
MSPQELGFVHTFVPAMSMDAPTLLLLHGTGGDENDLVPLGRALAPGAALLSPRGPVLESGMPRFFRRLAEGVFDTEDLIRRTHQLADFVGAASAAYGLDPSNVIAVGFSNGANIAASVLLLRPTVLAGAALFAPMVPLEPAERPDLTAKPVFLGAGRRDPLVTSDNMERLAALLRAAGADVTLRWHPGGHALTPDAIQAAALWMKELR